MSESQFRRQNQMVTAASQALLTRQLAGTMVLPSREPVADEHDRNRPSPETNLDRRVTIGRVIIGRIANRRYLEFIRYAD